MQDMHIKQKYFYLKDVNVLFFRIEKLKGLLQFTFLKPVILVMKGIWFAAVAHPFVIWNRI